MRATSLVMMLVLASTAAAETSLLGVQTIAIGEPWKAASIQTEWVGDARLTVQLEAQPLDPKLAGLDTLEFLRTAVPPELVVDVKATLTGATAEATGEVKYEEAALGNSAMGLRAQGFAARLRSMPGAHLVATATYTGGLGQRTISVRLPIPPGTAGMSYDSVHRRFYDQAQVQRVQGWSLVSGGRIPNGARGGVHFVRQENGPLVRVTTVVDMQ